MNINTAMDRICAEYHRARTLHRPMQSAHEGIAVILEEYRELEAEVFRRRRIHSAMQREAVQLAAMALAFLCEIKP